MIQIIFNSRFFSFVLLTVLLASAVPFCSTSGAEESRIAVVDIQRVLVQSKAGKRARESFQKEFKVKQGILDEKGIQYEKMEKELTKNFSIMNDKTLKEKSETLEKKKKELVRDKEDFSDELRRRDNEIKRRIFTEIQDVVSKFGESNGYSIILTRDAGVIFMSGGVDVTEQVINLYDRKY